MSQETVEPEPNVSVQGPSPTPTPTPTPVPTPTLIVETTKYLYDMKPATGKLIVKKA